MQKRLLVTLLVGAVVACAKPAPAPVRPVAPPTTAVQSDDAPLVVSAPARPEPAPSVTPVAPVSPASAPVVTAPQESEPFLDSLRVMRPDSSARPTVRVAPEAVQAEAVALLAPAGVSWDIEVANYASHDRVQHWMSYFTGRARWHFERYLERGTRYDSMIRSRLAAAGLPQDLIYLAMIESGFNQVARSRVGATGLWQFMPETGRRYGLRQDAWVDERRDPFLATDAAIRMLSELNHRYGSLYLAAAAYNAGPGRVDRGLRRGDFGDIRGNDLFFAMADNTTFLRRETRDYVPKMIAAALLAKEPEKYGFTDLARWSPLPYDSIEIDDAVGLDVVARASGVSRDLIESLNPRFYRGVTPPERRVWLKVPPGAADTVAARLSRLPASERVTILYHTVARGETLSRIALRYGVSVNDLKSANNLRTTRIGRGQRLVVPTSLSRGWQRSAGSTRAAAGSRPTTTVRRTVTGGASAPAATPTTTRRTHIVRQGETLGGIAEAFNVPLSRLLEANGLTRRSTIRPGQAVRIPR